ncbi:reticulon-like protein B11 [Syzygium oleosum]|uniref:reticulon-like protein B11 n=1 Tax=Syzygium oleosum TaxID=219896 RepID=UPI0011D1DC43|nr:reticulon-like protein B11 [Syzygium oleosum]XP_030472567.1 reticulon-like protein B11 [Syzygium oleosum]
MGNSHQPRRRSVHQALGGGFVADLLLWKKRTGGATLLVGATALWFVFERAGYNVLSFVANVLLLLVAILFLWAKSASLLNRPLPPLPDLEISEQSIVKIAVVMQEWVNYTLSIARDITVGRNWKLFLQVALGLWFISYIGSLFNFITLVYIGVILSLTVPFLYDKYHEIIDEKLCRAHKAIQALLLRIDSNVLKMIPLTSNKEKKIQ